MPSHAHDCRSKHTHRHLTMAVVLTLLFACVEAFFGWHANSLALISDAGHMASDSFALALAAFAAWVASKPPSTVHSYGYGRAEVLAAWLSSMMVIALVAFIIFEAIHRLHAAQHINGHVVILTASIGLIVNLIIAWLLHRSEKTINTRAALLHVISDLLGSFAALISGIVISITGWTMIDPILSMFIGVLISVSAIRLLRESMLILMEGVPTHINWLEVKHALQNAQGVAAVHDLHVWTLSSGQVAMSAHIEMQTMDTWNDHLARMQTLLKERFDIHHTTIQPECQHSPSRACQIPRQDRIR